MGTWEWEWEWEWRGILSGHVRRTTTNKRVNKRHSQKQRQTQKGSVSVSGHSWLTHRNTEHGECEHERDVAYAYECLATFSLILLFMRRLCMFVLWRRVLVHKCLCRVDPTEFAIQSRGRLCAKTRADASKDTSAHALTNKSALEPDYSMSAHQGREQTVLERMQRTDHCTMHACTVHRTILLPFCLPHFLFHYFGVRFLLFGLYTDLVDCRRRRKWQVAVGMQKLPLGLRRRC